MADLILNAKNTLIKNGAWSITGAERTLYDQLDKMNDDGYSNDIGRARDMKTSAEVKTEASKFIQQYLDVKLEGKNVRSQLFSNTSSAKSTDNTQLSYQIDIKALARHLVNY